MLFERVYIDGMFDTVDNPDSPFVRFEGDFWVSLDDDCMHVLTRMFEYPTNDMLLSVEIVSLNPLSL